MYEGGISIETYSAGASRDVASMVDNEHLKCTAMLLLYITLESAISWTNFSALFLAWFYEIHIFGFPCCSTRENLSIDVQINYQSRTDIDEAKVITALQHKSK